MCNSPRRLLVCHVLVILVLVMGLSCARQNVVITPFANSPSPLVDVSPLSALMTPWSEPTPSPGMGLVKGRLVVGDPTALIGVSLFLGDIISIDNGGHIAFLNRKNAPIGRIDATTGRFIFIDVPPGEYALIISDVDYGSRVYLNSSGDIQVIKVVPDGIVNLGDIPMNQ